MRPPDNHVHTGWSWDTPTSSTMRKACERAVGLGLPAIAFTEHLDFTDWLDDDRATTDGLLGRHPAHQLPIDVQGYFAELTEVRERFPGCGSGPGWRPVNRTCSPPASGHTCATHPSTGCSARCTPSTSTDSWSASAGAVRRAGRHDAPVPRRDRADGRGSDVFQVLAHVDFPRRYWPGGHDRYVEKAYEEEYRAVFRALATTGRALEVNTTSPLASADQVRWFFEAGGEAVSFGSDAHAPSAVGQRFDLAVDVVEAAGFRPGRDQFDFWRR